MKGYEGYEIGLFLDISKAFDKVWHEGPIYQVHRSGISGELLNVLKDFLKNRKQQVVLNDPFSLWIR